MRTKRVNRYYCDFCKKAGCSAYHLRRHEESCTANPNRACRMCGTSIRLGTLVGILKAPGTTQEEWKAKMEKVRDLADNCPACILAAIRQSGVQHDLRLDNLDADSPSVAGVKDNRWWPSPAQPGVDCCLGFDFKKERDEYLSAKNEAQQGW